MDKRISDELLLLHEELLKAQLRTIKRLRGNDTEEATMKKESMSKVSVALDILKTAAQPLHISEIISRAKTSFGVSLDRESLVSALLKKMKAGNGIKRTAPNTFEINNEVE
jgi:hypothetical protein